MTCSLLRAVRRTVPTAFLACIASITIPAPAQSPELVDAILLADPVPQELTASLASEANPAAEITHPLPVREGEPTTLGYLSHVLVTRFPLSTSILYRLTGATRYAMRELTYRGIYPATAERDTYVSGEELLRYISVAIQWTDRYAHER